MSVWDTYQNRIDASGSTKREVFFNRIARSLSVKSKDSLSHKSVLIDGMPKNVTIINSDNLNEKIMLSLPGEDIRCGSLVEWANNYWLVNEKDANNELYTKVKLLQCNHLLKWVDNHNIIREQWCVIKDGTKYLTGEFEDKNFVVTRGDSRISMTIAKNEHTVKFGRTHRFLIDDPDSDNSLAYLLTKPLKVGNHYSGDGIYIFVLQEVVSTEYDNMDLGIADYYRHFPRETTVDLSVETQIDPDNSSTGAGKKVWL